jgi:tetratricopeptide (TPR) repeat protein
MPGTWKTVRVFISSTFRDMHAERDHLVKVVFPNLRERLEKHRIYLIDIDLRWGVTRGQAENDQVLDLCLQQIDECRPFFIGILGQRYGWVPTRYPVDALKKYGWIQQHTGKSVTELEILHGVLQNQQMRDRAFFYFRDPVALVPVPESIRRDVYADTDLELIRKLEDLKRQIRHSGYSVMENYPARWDAQAYDRPSRSHGRLVGLEAFGERVRDQLWQAIREELQLPGQPPVETAADSLAEEQDYHERFMESRLRVYVGREQINDTLIAFGNGDDQVPCLVTGPSGSGKSAALARFVRDYRLKQPQSLVISHFIGAGPRSTNLRDMLRRFCQVLKARFGFAEEVPEEVAKLSVTYRELVGKVPTGTRVLLVIDALNQLDEADRAQELYWLPVEFPPHVKVIISSITDSGKTEPVLEAFCGRKYCPVELEGLSDAEQREIIRQVPSLSAKTLDDDQVRLLLSNPAAANPLFLLVALEELRGFAPYERLNERIAFFPCEGDTVTAIFTQVIQRLAEEFNPKLVETVLTLLASARRGLSERELQELVAGIEDAEDLFPVLRQLRPYLLSRASLIDFYHRNLFKAVRERYLPSEEQQQQAHLRLADYFNAQDYWLGSLDDQQRSAQSFQATPGPANIRKVDELPWQLLQLRNWQRLFDQLADLTFLDLVWQQNQDDVLRYWRALESQSPFSMVTCYTPEYCQSAKNAWVPARLLLDTGKLPQAAALWVMIVEDCRLRRNPALGGALNNLGIAREVLRDLDGAMQCYAEQAQLCAAREDAFGLQAAFGNMGNVASELGDLDKALALYKEQERICRALDDDDGLHRALGNQGNVLAKRNDLDGALGLYRLQEEICRRVGNQRSLHIAISSQANIAFQRRDLARAETLATKAVSAFRELGVREFLWGALALLGHVYTRQGLPEAAKPLYNEAEAICRELGTTYYLAEMFHRLGVAALASFVEIHQPSSGVFNGLEEFEYHLARQDRTVDYLDIAGTAFRRALNLRPDWPEASYGLGRALELKGTVPDAIAAYEAALRLRPDWPELCAHLGALLVRQE